MSVIGSLVVDLVADAAGYKGDLDRAENETRGWARRISGVAQRALETGLAGAARATATAVGAVGAAAFQVSTQTQQAAADMAASLGLPTGAAQEFADVAREVYGNNFADSVTAAGEAVAEVARQMRLAAGDPALQRITEHAIALEDTFGTGVTESVAAAQQLMLDFGLTSEEAFDFIAAGYQRGLDASGDFLESVTEYSTQFANGGADAGHFFSVLETGMQAGTLGTDKAADAFKEFRLRIIDGSDSTANALELIGLSAEEMEAAINSGSMTTADAFSLVTQKLAETEDASTRMQAGAGLLGSQFEDLGDTAVSALDLTATKMGDLSGSADTLNNKYETFGDRFSAMWRRVVVAVSPLTDKLLELAENALPQVEAGVETMTPIIVDMATAIGPMLEQVVSWIQRFNELSERNQRIILIVGGVVAAIVPLAAILGPLVTTISAIVSVAGTLIPALGTVAGAVMALVNPFTLVVAAVAALVIAWRTDFLGIKTHTLNLLDNIRAGFSNFAANVQSSWQQFTSRLAQDSQIGMQQVSNAFSSGYNQAQNAVINGSSSIQSAFSNGMQFLQTAAQQGWEWVRQTFEWSVGAVADVVRYLDWTGLGYAIVEGIANGIRNGAGAIADAARDAARRALDAARNLLGIDSPSKVAAEEIGVPIAEGIGVGMDDGLGAMSGMIGAGLDAMIGGVAPSAAGAGVGTIQINQYFGADVDRAAVAAGAQDGLLAGLRQAGLR